MSKQPKNGDLIKCDTCQACHRLTTPTNRVTGATQVGILAFNCNGFIRIAFIGGKAQGEFPIVEPVGVTAPKEKDHIPLYQRKSARRKGVDR